MVISEGKLVGTSIPSWCNAFHDNAFVLMIEDVSTENFVRTPCYVPPKGAEDGCEILLIVWLRPVF